MSASEFWVLRVVLLILVFKLAIRLKLFLVPWLMIPVMQKKTKRKNNILYACACGYFFSLFADFYSFLLWSTKTKFQPQQTHTHTRTYDKKKGTHFKIIIIICIQNIFADNIFCRTKFKANYFMLRHLCHLCTGEKYNIFYVGIKIELYCSEVLCFCLRTHARTYTLINVCWKGMFYCFPKKKKQKTKTEEKYNWKLRAKIKLLWIFNVVDFLTFFFYNFSYWNVAPQKQ